MFSFRLPILVLLVVAGFADAQTPLVQTAGTVVNIPADGTVTVPNDEVKMTFMIEEQDKDKAAAASRVNLKMKQALEIIKREDPAAILKTHGYYTYPVYPENQSSISAKSQQPVGWRVAQYLDLVTTNLGHLPKTVASAQKIFVVNGLEFGLTDAAKKQLDQKQIDAAYAKLNERIAAIASAMGRNMADAVLETIDFDGVGGGPERPLMQSMSMAKSAMQVSEPSFEPGETTLNMRVVAKVRFK